jgi:glycosyltransferase involved in cell wall biosynthesis
VSSAGPPLVSVVLAAHDAEPYLAGAVRSVLGQTLEDLELIVVDDGSTDGSPELLERIGDPRLVVVRNEERAGLARALNRGLEQARGRYVARLDADDLALPQRLERQLARLRGGSVGIVGSAVLDIDDRGRPGALREMPAEPLSVRWHALFGSPFYHPAVLLDKNILDRHQLAYDPAYEESEDFDLWARLLAVTNGANLAEPLVLYRVHAGQASSRRRDLQRSFQLEVALRQIADLDPSLRPKEAELAWSLGAGERVAPDRIEDAAHAYLELLEAFRRRHGRAATGAIARSAAGILARAALTVRPPARARVLGLALALRPVMPVEVAVGRLRRRVRAKTARRQARAVLGQASLRVVVVAPEPTPYRAPVFDVLAQRPELDLTVVYAGRTLMWRTWHVEPRHRALFLHGVRVPGARRLLHHEFPVTPGIFRRLAAAQPDAVVVVGWSTFASLATISWCRLRRVPYVLEVDSHDEGPRAGWRRAVKGTVVPRIVRGAAGVLVTGTLVRRSMIARGADPDRIRLFAVTVDAAGFRRRAEELASRRAELRCELELGTDDVAVLSVGRLAPEKGLDTLIRAAAAARVPELAVVIAGSGPEHARLEQLAASLGVRLVLLGDSPWERMVERYVAADVFALLSEREPWGVVVNEAAACGLPLVLSDRVGAAFDLLRDGENGVLVPAGDVESAASAVRRLAQDPAARAAAGARSLELMEGWGYEPSIEGFLGAVRAAVSR